MTILIEGSIQDVVSTYREVDYLPKQFLFKHFDDFVFSLVGTIQCLSVCFWKIKVSTDDNWFVFRNVSQEQLKYRYELVMGGL